MVGTCSLLVNELCLEFGSANALFTLHDFKTSGWTVRVTLHDLLSVKSGCWAFHTTQHNVIDQQQEVTHYIEIQPQSGDKSNSFVTQSCFSTMVGYGLNPENNQINNELTTTLSPNDSIVNKPCFVTKNHAIKRTRNDAKQHVRLYPVKKKRTQHANVDVRQKLVLHKKT